MQFKIHAKNPIGNSFVEVINGRKNNLCTILIKAKMDPYLHKLIQNMARYTNLFEVCPVPLVGFFITLNERK